MLRRGHRRCTSSGSTASPLIHDTEVLVTTGCNRGHRRHDPGSVRTGRRGGHLRAVLRLVCGLDRAGRRRPPGRSARGRPPGPSTLDQLAGGHSATGPASCCSTLLTTRPERCSTSDELAADRRAVRRTRRRSPSPTRSTSTSSSRASTSRSRLCRACATAPSTISSAGKTFSVTGWKIGWICASEGLVSAVSNGQAVPDLRERHALPVRRRRRSRPSGLLLRRHGALLSGEPRPALRRSGGKLGSPSCGRPAPISPSVDVRSLGYEDGFEFCKELDHTLTAWRRSRPRSSTPIVPPAVPLVRFAFCKRPEVLAEAIDRLSSLAKR